MIKNRYPDLALSSADDVFKIRLALQSELVLTTDRRAKRNRRLTPQAYRKFDDGFIFTHINVLYDSLLGLASPQQITGSLVRDAD